MPSSGMLCHVALVRTDVLEELGMSTIRVTKIGELGTTLAVTINQHTLRRNTKYSNCTRIRIFTAVKSCIVFLLMMTIYEVKTFTFTGRKCELYYI
jgi:hypothetical protein